MKRLYILIVTLLLSACGEAPSLLEEIKQQGELVVATHVSVATYYPTAKGPAGFEYDLVKRFAAYLGVKPRFVVADYASQILPMVASGQVHLAAAGIINTQRRQRAFLFGPTYQRVTPKVVYHVGYKRPRKLSDMADGMLDVVAGSAHEEILRDKRRRQYPKLEITTHNDVSSESLASWVASGLIDYTVVNSNELMLLRRYYSELRVGFALADSQKLAWALIKTEDKSLLNEVSAFFATMDDSGELDYLIERYYGYNKPFSTVDVDHFVNMIPQRLSMYRHWFRQAEDLTGFDWRLLAAVGYQESHWDPAAVSPTGVRGIMMLTRGTAKQMGVSNRTEPRDSILGGAKYLKRMHRKIPQRVQEPDRTWLALASYNVGYGHLEDARILCQREGGNPDHWADVKEYLPRLSKKKWHKTTRYGYARGWEPVRYVDAIRGYYDVMKRHFPDDFEQVKAGVQFPALNSL